MAKHRSIFDNLTTHVRQLITSKKHIMKTIFKNHTVQFFLCLFLLTLGITHEARAQLADTCVLEITYEEKDVNINNVSQASVSSLGDASISIEGVKNAVISKDKALIYSSNFIEIKEGEFTGYTSLVPYDSIINYFEASEYFDFGKIKLNWSLSDIFSGMNYGDAITPKIFLTRTDPNGDMHILDTCIEFGDLEYIDKNLGSGGKYLYCAQGFALDDNGNIIQMGTRFCDYGQTDKFQLIADNNRSDAEIQVQWDIDANCLEGPNGEEVYFQVKDLTEDKEIYVQTIEDPSAYLYFGSFKNNYSLNFDGTNSRVNLPEYTIEGKNNWTAELWIKPDNSESASGDHFILSNTDNKGLYYSYTDNNKAALKYLTNTGSYASLDITIPLGEWTHIAVSSSSSTTKFYVDGIFQTSISDAMRWTFDFLGNDTPGKTMQGILANFRVWDDVRSTQELAYNYLYGLRGDEHTLVAYYKMDEGDISSAVIKDETNKYPATALSATITTFIEDTEENQEFHYIVTENVHQDEYHNYQLAIYTIGKGEQVCDIISDDAETAPLNKDILLNTTVNDPGKITLSWEGLKSDWANGYKVYRREGGSGEWKYLATIQDTSYKYYEDYFSFTSDNSIKIGSEYEYMVKAINNKYGEIALSNTPEGQTLDYALSLEAKNDSIYLSWPDFTSVSGEYDTLKITRDGDLLRFTTTSSENSLTDPYPVYGKEHEYGLVFVKDGKEYAGVFNTIGLSENGVISGKILTAIGQYPVENVKINAEAVIDGKKQVVSTTTDNLGRYTLKNIYYGDKAEFTITPSLPGHSFVDSTGTEASTRLILDRFNPELPGADFFSLREYEVVSNDKHSISNLSNVVMADTVQFFNIKWSNNLEIHSNYTDVDLYFNVYRDDKLISTFVKTVEANGEDGIVFTDDIVFSDSTASPNKSYDYTVYSYYFEGDNKLYSKNTSRKFSWGKVPNYITNFTAIPDVVKGVVALSWTNEKAWNCDGYLLERKANGSGLTETVATIEDAGATSYIDEESASGTTFTYLIRPYINNNGPEIVPSEDTTAFSAQYPALVTPNIHTKAESESGYVTINGNIFLNTRKENYNFSGLKIFRVSAEDSIEISDITFEALEYMVETEYYYRYSMIDKTGIPGTTYKYVALTYKNTNNGTIISDYGESTVSYPELPAPSLTAGNGNNAITLRLNYSQNANIDGVYFLRTTDINVTPDSIATIEAGQLEYLDVINTSTSGTYHYKAVSYKTVDNNLYVNIPTDFVSATVNIETGILEAPTGFTASNAYDNYVELNWEYPTYKHADFILFRDETALDTVSYQYRSFKDYNADFGVEYAYKIRALMDGVLSSNVVATGQKMAKHTVSGNVFTHNQLNGINNAEVKMIWYNNSTILHFINTTTDAAGFYLFNDVPYFSNATSVTIGASKTNHLFGDKTLPVTEDNYIYSGINFIDGVEYPSLKTSDLLVTEAEAVSAFANDVAGNVEVSWKPQNNNFDGFIIYRDYEPIMNYTLHSGDYAVIDSLGSPGHEYIYSVQPFWDSPVGYQEGTVVDIPLPVLYPGYAMVTQVTAVAKEESNQVEVYWSHVGEATYFEVYRSEELIAVVNSEEKHQFVDSTGIPGLSYKYRVRSYNVNTGQYSDFTSTSVIYPELVPPVNFAATSDKTMNEVDLSWNYNGRSINGYVIFRNEVKLATINHPETTSWTDTSGIPETWHEYDIVAFREDNSNKYYSESVTDTAFYPEIEDVGSISVYDEDKDRPSHSIPDNLITLEWSYIPENIEGFYLFRDDEPLATLGKNDTLYTDYYGLPGRKYTYRVYAYDYRGDDLKEYLSDEVRVEADYPHYPNLTSTIGTNTSNSYSSLSWTYDWTYIDGFIISRGTGSGNISDFDTIPSWSRAYFDHINVCGSSYYYSVEPYRIINGNYATSGQAIKTTPKLTLSSCASSNHIFDSFTASQGDNKDKVKLNWSYIDNVSVDKVVIYRASSGGSFVEIAEKNSQWNAYTDEDVIDGEVYQYKITPKVGSTAKNSLTAKGYSQAEGKISGLVQAYQDKSALAGITVKALAVIDGVAYAYSQVTNSNGMYDFDELFMKPGETTTYTITASYENHRFLNNSQDVELSEEMSSNTTDETIYDLESRTISGYATYANYTKCKLDSVKISLNYIDALNNAFTENVYTDEDGYYSFILKSLNDIEAYGVVADGYLSSNGQIIPTWNFDPDSLTFNVDEIDGSLSNVNFADTTTYNVSVEIANGCGMPLGDYYFRVGVESANGCFYETYTTNANGNLDVALPPLNYTFRIIDATPLDVTSQPIIDYFRVRPANLELATLHEYRVSRGISGAQDTAVSFAFHKVPEVIMTASSFTDPSTFDCSLEGIHIAMESVGSYSGIQFAVMEEYNGENCPVSEGYLIVKNNAASSVDQEQLINHDASTEMFEPYSFTVGDPNTVAPFFYDMSVEYYSEGGEFLADLTEYVIVTGDLDIEGNDVLVVPDRDGDDIQVPLFVLRDPPGDNSYSYIDKEVGITKNLSVKKSDGVELKFDEEAKIGVVAYNILQDYHAQGDFNSDESYNLALSVKTSEKISTTSSPILSVNDKKWVIGENADVVVGLGIALQTGIAENVTLVKDFNDPDGGCVTLNYLDYKVSTDSISTQWIYSESQIRNIVRNYNDILEEQIGSDYVAQIEDNGTEFGYDTMSIYYAWKNWNEIHDYYKIKTLPHYQLCSDKYDPDVAGDLKDFCENFFTFNESAITGLNTEGGNWNNKWMDIYNAEMNKVNTEYSKLLNDGDWDVLDYNGSGGLYTVEGKLNPINVSNQFANNQEEAKRVFEEQYTNAGVENITFTGGTKYEKQVSSKIQGKYNYNQYYAFKDYGGVGLKGEVEIKSKIKGGANAKTNLAFFSVGPFGKSEIEVALKTHYSLMIKSQRSNKVTFTENSGIMVDSTYKVGYVLSDNDDGDQFSTMVIKGTTPGHTPYFGLIGGRSMCPYEEGTISRYSVAASIVDEDGLPTNNAQYNLAPDDPTVFHARISNSNPFGEDLLVDISGMPMGGNETENINKIIYGEKLRPTKRVPLLLPADSSLLLDIFVERINPMEYEYPNIELLIRPTCESSPFFGDTLTFAAFFRKPCSNITIAEPESGWVINKSPDGYEENLSMKLMDYTTDGEIFNLDSVVVQYRREGSNDWNYLSGVTFETLADYYEEYKTVYKEPVYPVIWNITGNDDIVDGKYEIRAMCECGTDGYTFSNVISGTVDRTSLRVFEASPTDEILSLDEYVSVTFNDNIDTEILVEDSITVVTAGGTKVSYELFADGSEITLKLNEEQLHALHDSTLTATVAHVSDIYGNQLDEPYSWSFRVNYSPVYFNPYEMVESMEREDIAYAEATLTTNRESINTFRLTGYDTSWITVINEYGVEIPEGTTQLFRQSERNIYLMFNSNRLWPGVYTDTIFAETDGYRSAYLVISLTVQGESIDWNVDFSNFTRSMNMITNFRLVSRTNEIVDGQYVTDSTTFSADTLDVIGAYIDNTRRGVAKITKITDERYAAYLSIHGNEADFGQEVDFSIYDASTGIEYHAIPASPVAFKADTVYGTSASPDTLIIDIWKNRIRRIYFDAGWNMFSINGLPAKPAFEDVFDGLELTDGDMIKNHNGTTMVQYNGETESWGTSGVDTITPGYGYWIYLAKENILEFSGDETSVYNSFNLEKPEGWYMVGSPVQMRQDINGSMLFKEDKPKSAIIKSDEGLAEYEGGAWTGSLDEIRPFEAYKVKADVADILKFTLTDGITGYPEPDNQYLKSAGAGKAVWNIHPANYEHNLTITGEIVGSMKVSEKDQVIAFDANNVVRGVGEFSHVRETNRYIVSMFVYGNNEEALSFRYYSASENLTFDITNTFNFKANDRVGKLSDVYEFTVDESSAERAINNVYVYPNPFIDAIHFDFYSEDEEEITVTLSDVLGQTMIEQNINATKGMNYQSVNVSALNLASGLYILKLTTNNNSTILKTMEIVKE